MDTLKFGPREVGIGQPTFIVAEAGSNHNRDLNIALRLIDVAAEAGADAVKFQIFRAETLYSRYTPRLSEMDGRSEPSETPFELIRRCELPREWLPTLSKHARERGILFTASPFDLEAVELMARIDVPFYKVASYEIVDVQLLSAIAAKGKPAILSTGNSGLADIETGLRVFADHGNDQVALLHCVSQYPARYADLNLRCIGTLQRAFRCTVGFSDHTMDSRAAIVAVSLGGSILEKHFTLSRDQVGPDHSSSLEPQELAQYVCDVRDAEQSLGDGVKRVMASEQENHQLARRSIHARIAIARGTRIEQAMVCIKRPALGIDPREMDRLIGRTAQTDIQEDAWITWGMV